MNRFCAVFVLFSFCLYENMPKGNKFVTMMSVDCIGDTGVELQCTPDSGKDCSIILFNQLRWR